MQNTNTNDAIKLFDSTYPASFQKVGKYTVSYRDIGQKNKPVIVMLHGNPTWSYLYRKMIPYFSEYRVILPDLLGYGYSDKPNEEKDLDMGNITEIVDQLLSELRVAPQLFIGQDWGGAVASSLAAKHDHTSIVLMNTYLPGIQIFSRPIRYAIRSTAGKLLIIKFDVFRKMAFRIGFHKKLSVESREAYSFPHDAVKDRRAVWSLPSQIPDHSNDSSYTKTIDTFIQNPSVNKLILWGVRDPAITLKNAQKAASELPNTSFIEVQEASHFLQEDQPQFISQSILKWLKNQKSRQ